MALVEYFLTQVKLDPNIRFENNDTALHKAAEKNLEPVALMLVEHGKINVNIGNIYGMTPLNIGANIGSLEVVKILLEHGANVDIANKMLYTPLHNAVFGNHIDIVNLLLDFKANPNSLNAFHITPLFLAANEKNNYEITQLLLTRGADPNFWSQGYTMPLLIGKNGIKLNQVNFLHSQIYFQNVVYLAIQIKNSI